MTDEGRSAERRQQQRDLSDHPQGCPNHGADGTTTTEGGIERQTQAGGRFRRDTRGHADFLAHCRPADENRCSPTTPP